jgi:DNA-binding response OmpR family regulator
MDDYLAKPISLQQLEEVIQRVLKNVGGQAARTGGPPHGASTRMVDASTLMPYCLSLR